MQMRLFISASLINYSRSSSVGAYLWAFGPPLMKDAGGGGGPANWTTSYFWIRSATLVTPLLSSFTHLQFVTWIFGGVFYLPLRVNYATNVILFPFLFWGKLRKRLSKNNVKTSSYSEASFMSCQHLQKHLCCGKMRADLQDADKMPSHCWSIGPGRTMLIFSASDFGDGFKGGLFFLICTYQSRFPSTPSGNLISLKGDTSLSVNEEKLPMEEAHSLEWEAMKWVYDVFSSYVNRNQ